MVAPVSFRALQAHDLPRFERLFALYEEALPRHEQKPRARLLEMFATSDYTFVYAERDAQAAGFAIVYRFERLPLMLLEYLAVAEHERARGLGARLFSLAVWLAGARTLLIEMDAPQEGVPETVRRHHFYRRQGCQRVGALAYVLPLPGLTPPPMWLLTHGGPPIVARDELASWLRALYQEVYRCDASDPRIEHMLQSEVRSRNK